MMARSAVRQRGFEAAARSIEVLLGRRATVRYARFLLDEARLDGRPDMNHNGEMLVQRGVLAHGREPALVLDVGAHFGEWTGLLGRTATKAGARARVHLFEPTQASFLELERTVTSMPSVEVTLNNVGMSSRSGSRTIFKPAEGAGASSLHRPEFETTGSVESVSVTTVDEYCREHGIERVDLLKCDAEGHDLSVLEGARGLLTEQRVSALQFEYNFTWIYARRYLRDAFELLKGMDYTLGKVTPRGIEYYHAWDPELETFRFANYLAVTADARRWFPSIRWWKG